MLLTISGDNIIKRGSYYRASMKDEDVGYVDNCDFTIDDGVIQITDLEKKRYDARKLIESRYKEHDQINILRNGTQEEINEMNTYIDGILEEFRTNGKDADYSQFI